MVCRAKRVLGFSVCIIIMAVLTGCGGTGKVIYRPVIQPDMTLAAAVNDLQNAARSGKIISATGPLTPVRSISNIIVHENGTVRWEFPPEPRHPRAIEMSLFTLQQDLVVNDWGPSWAITLPDFMISGSLPNLQKAADDLYCIQQKLENLTEKQNKELALFEPIAVEYRSLSIKPQITEAQRKLIVQANASNQKKEYGNAIDLYIKALELDPTAYPEAYFNLALLFEQQQWYASAISYMKHYLLLVPEAQDARNAQDKIYEWELLIQK